MPTTNILTSYAVPRTGERSMHGVEEYLVAGAIVLEMIWKEGQLARSLVIEKMRCTNVKPAQYDIDIVKEQGIVFQPCRERVNRPGLRDFQVLS
jgi:KaiC/GvpD/RAD55 family RecA-like ATPase